MYAEQLERIQRELAVAFRRFVPVAEQADLRATISAIVSGNDRLTPEEQADIYREQFWLRHRDSLYEDYPGLLHLLGEEAFEELLRAYLVAHPPDSWTLRDLGNRLPEFAESYAFEPARAAAARDMARFELAFNMAWDGPDAQPVALEAVTAIPPEAWTTAKIALHPVLTLFTLGHAVHEVRMQLKAGQEAARDLAPAPTFLALWRGTNDRVHYRALDEAEHAFLKSLRAGATLGEACDEAAARTGDAEALAHSLQRWFRTWTKRGWIVGVATR